MVRGVGLGESRAALVSAANVKSAAIARILEGAADSKPAWTKPILQQAPPSHAKAATRATPAGILGPLRVGSGSVAAHARWEDAMTCGRTAGEASRSAATMNGLSLLGNGSAALVHVPEQSGSLTTTALDRRGDSSQTVASATVKAGRIELAGGQVRVRMLQPPSLVTTMSVRGGQAHYEPAQIEVSGPGIGTKRLDAVGEHVDVTLGPDRHAAEASTLGLGKLRPGSPLPLPVIPGLPQVTTPSVESAPAAEAGTKLRISLGGMREARKGHAIAARATAIKVSVTRTAAPKGRGGSGYQGKTGAVALDLGVGLMEAASVAPEPGQVGGSAGAAGGLPITGPKVAGLAVGGLALLGVGIAAVALSVRRRRTRG
ncbi:hypothetical protein [Paractinoplanes rishiriensis]|uniref:Uncharacterized protein n=1 Tax=Paractinoplanes rishiriensis TaxID=1050105 RepID=A0A919JZU7_9ACTN|nr:hypothetical protein [Actinoplanes rishiriensis]GIE98281.1 hypothetical protein Ari01nite_57460 [Actinoplanes rishiriensis]